MSLTKTAVFPVFALSLVLLVVSLSIMVSNSCYQADEHDWFKLENKPYGFQYLSERIMQCKYNEAYSWTLYAAIIGVLIQAVQLVCYIFEIQTHICHMKDGQCRRSPDDSSLDAFFKVISIIAGVLMVIGAAMVGLYDFSPRAGHQNYGREHGAGVAILVTAYLILHVEIVIYRARVWVQEEHNAEMTNTGVISSFFVNLLLLTIAAVFLVLFFLESFNLAILSENALIAFALCLQGINLYWYWTINEVESPEYKLQFFRLGTRQPAATTYV